MLVELFTAVSVASPPSMSVAPGWINASLWFVLTRLSASAPATLTPLAPLAPDAALAPKLLVPLPVIVADSVNACAWITAFWPMVAWLVDVATLMATPTPTSVLLPLPDGAAALPSAPAVAPVSLLLVSVSVPPALTLPLLGRVALTAELAMLTPIAAATPTWPSLVLALGTVAPLALVLPPAVALPKAICWLACKLALF